MNKRAMAQSIIFDTDLDKLINASAPWNLFLSDKTDTSSSSRSDAGDIFDDTYSDLESIEKASKVEHELQRNKVSEKIHPEIEESLIKRVELLKERITSLRQLLNEETRLWKQEREEYDLIQETMNVSALEEAAAVAREASEAYIIESIKGSFLSTPSCSESPQSVLNLDYYQVLSQVEQLCNEELLKIRSDADLLKPLKQMASQWDGAIINHP